MPKPVETYMHILVRDRAWLSPLGTMGPVIHPIKVNKKDVIKLIMSGCQVYEYLLDSKQTIKLTVHNIRNDKKRHEDYFKEIEAKEDPQFFGIEEEESNELQMSIVSDDKEENMFAETTTNVVEGESMTIDFAEEAAAKPESNIEEGPITADTYVFALNEDGTVDESTISWNLFSGRDERRALRARINAINAEAKAR